MEFKSLILQNFRGINRISDRLNMSPDFAWNISNGYVKKDIKTGLGILVQRKGIEKFSTERFGLYPNTKLLIHFNGSDAVTEYTAESGQTVTFVGTAQLDTAQKKFGTASLLLDGNSDYVTVPDSTDWYFGTGDFTIEAQVRLASDAAGCIIGQIDGAGTTGWELGYSQNSATLVFKSFTSSATDIEISCPFDPSINTWYHVCITRSGNTWRMFVDGVEGTITKADGEYDATIPNVDGALVIGYTSDFGFFNGWIDEPRIIKGGAAYTDDFDAVTRNYDFDTASAKYIYEAKWDAGGTDIIIRQGTRWAKWDGANTFTDLDTGRTDGVRGMCVMFGNELIMVDGGTPRKCNSSYTVANLSADGAMPADSTAIHVHQHKVWLNSSAAPMKAYYSKTDSANEADSFSAAGDAGYLDFSKILPYGDKLLGFATFGEMALVFIFTKHVVVYSCGTDPAEFAIQQIIPLNCISGHGIQQIGNDLAITSQEGVNSFRASMANQDLDTDDISKYIAPLYRDLISDLQTRTVVSLGFSHRLNHLYVCIPTTDHTILVYSVDIQNFVGVWTGYKCYSICERVDGTMLIAGDGYIYTMNSGNSDDGVQISFQYDLPFLYGKDPNNNKSFRQLEGLCRYTGNPLIVVDYSYEIDVVSGVLPSISIPLSQGGGTYWDEGDWDTSSWDSPGIERIFTSDMIGRGKQIAISLRNSVLDSYIEIPYLILRYKTENSKVR